MSTYPATCCYCGGVLIPDDLRASSIPDIHFLKCKLCLRSKDSDGWDSDWKALAEAEQVALKRAKEVLGPDAKTEYDPKMTALKCWLWDVSERGWTRAGTG
jgi:hypothetical protein